jgi:hypothetical protein
MNGVIVTVEPRATFSKQESCDMKKIIFGPILVAVRGALRVIDSILNPQGESRIPIPDFPRPYSFHQPLFLG